MLGASHYLCKKEWGLNSLSAKVPFGTDDDGELSVKGLPPLVSIAFRPRSLSGLNVAEVLLEPGFVVESQ